MSLIVQHDQLPVVYLDWSEWRLAQRELLDAAAPGWLVAPASSFCPACWGAGRIWEPAANGEGLVPRECGACRGQRSIV